MRLIYKLTRMMYSMQCVYNTSCSEWKGKQAAVCFPKLAAGLLQGKGTATRGISQLQLHTSVHQSNLGSRQATRVSQDLSEYELFIWSRCFLQRHGHKYSSRGEPFQECQMCMVFGHQVLGGAWTLKSKPIFIFGKHQWDTWIGVSSSSWS